MEDRVLDAAKDLCERWGRAKVTVDDIAVAAGCSRATLYRLFPGGKEILFEALRARSHERFFVELTAHLSEAEGYEDLVVTAVVEATRALQADEHLRVMLASVPGEVAGDLTVDGLPRIIDTAAAFLRPWFAPYLGEDGSDRLAEWLSRLVTSYFLVPSRHVNLAESASAIAFVHDFVLPAFPAEPAPALSRR